MICEKCGKCKSITNSKGVYEISCVQNGLISIHSSNTDRFNCDKYIEKEIEEPKEPNILVILKTSGRDISVYDDRISNGIKLAEVFEHNKSEYIMFGDFIIKCDDISVVAYIGEK